MQFLSYLMQLSSKTIVYFWEIKLIYKNMRKLKKFIKFLARNFQFLYSFCILLLSFRCFVLSYDIFLGHYSTRSQLINHISALIRYLSSGVFSVSSSHWRQIIDVLQRWKVINYFNEKRASTSPRTDCISDKKKIINLQPVFYIWMMKRTKLWKRKMHFLFRIYMNDYKKMAVFWGQM